MLTLSLLVVGSQQFSIIARSLVYLFHSSFQLFLFFDFSSLICQSFNFIQHLFLHFASHTYTCSVDKCSTNDSFCCFRPVLERTRCAAVEHCKNGDCQFSAKRSSSHFITVNVTAYHPPFTCYIPRLHLKKTW